MTYFLSHTKEEKLSDTDGQSDIQSTITQCADALGYNKCYWYCACLSVKDELPAHSVDLTRLTLLLHPLPVTLEPVPLLPTGAILQEALGLVGLVFHSTDLTLLLLLQHNTPDVLLHLCDAGAVTHHHLWNSDCARHFLKLAWHL